MPDFSIEDEYPDYICAGIDEVGRGPLAGPVVTACVIIPDRSLPFLQDIRDSKKLSISKRDYLAEAIRDTCLFSISQCSVEEIDELNILWATMRAMERAADKLQADMYLIDGNRIPNGLNDRAKYVIKGDDKSLSISCASILAKVERDRIMTQLDQEFPGYGWANNAGYGTKGHINALNELGVTRHHRRSFAPVRACLQAGKKTA